MLEVKLKAIVKKGAKINVCYSEKLVKLLSCI